MRAHGWVFPLVLLPLPGEYALSSPSFWKHERHGEAGHPSQPEDPQPEVGSAQLTHRRVRETNAHWGMFLESLWPLVTHHDNGSAAAWDVG